MTRTEPFMHDSLQKIDAVTLKHLASELHRMLFGARVSRIIHPNAKEFVITFWGHGQEELVNDAEGRETSLIPRGELNQFYINLHPELCYALLLAPGEKDRLIRGTLHHPTSICMLLRKHLSNAKVVAVFSLPNERVLNIRFENFNELGNKVSLVLTLELMGKHSNMMLYDELSQDILAISHSVSDQMSRYREVTVGTAYAPPPRDKRKQPLEQLTAEGFKGFLSSVLLECQNASAEDLAELLATHVSDHLEGFGKRMLLYAFRFWLAERGLSKQESLAVDAYHFLLALVSGDLSPYVSADGQSFSLLPIEGGQAYPWVHDMLRAYLLPKTSARRVRDYQRQLLQIVDAQEKRRLKREQTLTPIAESDILALQQSGHLIMTAMSTGEVPPKPTSSAVQVPNIYGDGESVSLEVDPSLGWMENAEQYYRRAKKAKARQAQYEKQYETLENERAFLAELSLMVQQAEALKMLGGIEEDLVAQGLMKSSAIVLGKQKKQANKTSGVLTVQDESGVQYAIGRTSQANGDIVGHLAKPLDWWFHVHQMPGSHVMVKLPQANPADKRLPDDVVLKASNLAVYFSSGRDSKNVPVVYTQMKHVRKIPGSYPGHVTYKQENSVFITADTELVNSLLAGDSPKIAFDRPET